MRMLWSIIVVLHLAHRIQASGFYTIIAPPVVRPNSKYQISIETVNTKAPVNVTIGIYNDPAGYDNAIEVSVPSNTLKEFTIDVGDIVGFGGYKLKAWGSGGLSFAEEAWLTFNPKSYSIIAQTDKKGYRPGETVHFRVMIVDENAKPLKLTKKLSIFIEGPRGKRVKNWDDVVVQRMVYTNQFQLSSAPSLGEWTINVQYGNDIQFLRFEVDSYVEPKIELVVTAATRNTFKSGKFSAVIAARYAFGQPILGLVTVRATATYGFLWKMPSAASRRTVPISDKTTVTWDIEPTFGERNTTLNTAFVAVDAQIKDDVTGKIYKGRMSIPIYDDDFMDLRITDFEKNFKPGLPFTFAIQMLKLDTNLLIDTETPINVVTYYGWDDGDRSVSQVYMDKTGRALVSQVAPLSADVLDFQISYKDYTNFLYLPPYASNTGAFISATVTTSKLVVGGEVNVNVLSTENLNYLTYIVVGRGSLLVSKTIRIVGNKKFGTFNFRATFDMMPVSKLLVYYYRSNGEIISDVKTLRFEEKLDNFLNIKLSMDEVNPGQNIKLAYETKCDSLIGVWGVDQNSMFESQNLNGDKVQVVARGPQGVQGQQGGSGSKVIGFLAPSKTVEEEMAKVSYSGETTVMNQKAIFAEIAKFDAKFGSYPTPKAQSARPHDMSHVAAFSRLVDEGTVVFTNAKKYKLNRAIFSVGNSDAGSPGGTGGMGGAGGVGTAIMAFIPKVIRNRFPETWLWDSRTVTTPSEDGKNTCKADFTIKAPRVLSSFSIRGFSLNEKHGLGFGTTSSDLKVSEPITVSTTLPYAVKRGETMNVILKVFNSYPSAQNVKVILWGYKNFEFVENDTPVLDHNKNSNAKYQNVVVNAETGIDVKFSIKAVNVGYVRLSMAVSTGKDYSGTFKDIFIEPEGVPVYINSPILIDLRKKTSYSTTYSINVPASAVADSVKSEVMLYTDLLGASVQNLAKSLIRLPTGCGEQNMLNMVPNIAVLDFYKAMSYGDEKSVRSFLEAGYINQLAYQRFDGSFSAFGESDTAGSTWLTAFVVKYLYEARRHIFVDDKTMSEAMQWLVGKQTDEGEFQEGGRSVHSEMANGGGVALTAFALIAMMSMPNVGDTYDDNLQRATNYIVQRLDSVEHLYTQAIAAYALQLRGHESAAGALQKFNKLSKKKFGRQWWSMPGTGPITSIDMEITAYGLLANLRAGNDAMSFSILNFLLKHQSAKGGVFSSQDTAISVEAIAKMAAKYLVKDTNIDVTVSDSFNDYQNTMTKNRATFELSPAARKIKISASGKGFAIAQVSYQYNMMPAAPKNQPQFKLEVKQNAVPSTRYIGVDVCASFVPTETVTASNMAIVEIQFPSGFTFDQESAPKIVGIQTIKKVDVKNENSVALIYFEYLDDKAICFTADAFQTTVVDGVKGGLVTIYDYYLNEDPNDANAVRRATVTF